ncbi:MAG: response regulator [Chitinophagaceae bacterium]|nr:response regulator [Chitinophagaceae bacterium]
MKQTILVINDSKAIRFLLQTILSKKYNVISFPDGCSTMQWLLRKNIPQLIIADPQLPDCENWELISNLHSSGLYGGIPVIVLSNLSEEEMIVRCTEYTNVIRSFSQPFNPLELLEVVENMVLAKMPSATMLPV